MVIGTAGFANGEEHLHIIGSTGFANGEEYLKSTESPLWTNL
jgi:hypothetical protein